MIQLGIDQSSDLRLGKSHSEIQVYSNEMITFGNGQQLSIRYIDNTNIRGNVRNLVLKSLMHVPLISKT